jgi:hypothetical protein
MRVLCITLTLIASLLGCEGTEQPSGPPPTAAEIGAALNQSLAGLAKKANGYDGVRLRDGYFLAPGRYRAFVDAHYVWRVDRGEFEHLAKQFPPPAGKTYGLFGFPGQGEFQKGDVICPDCNIQATLVRCQKSWQVEDLAVKGLNDPLELRDLDLDLKNIQLELGRDSTLRRP